MLAVRSATATGGSSVDRGWGLGTPDVGSGVRLGGTVSDGGGAQLRHGPTDLARLGTSLQCGGPGRSFGSATIWPTPASDGSSGGGDRQDRRSRPRSGNAWRGSVALRGSAKGHWGPVRSRAGGTDGRQAPE